jgi:hypothetical protein
MGLKILMWLFGVALTIGFGEALVDAIWVMANKAAAAHHKGMMSQSKWNRALWSSKATR